MSWDEYIAWLDFGIEKGWISEPVCVTHDGLPITEEEAKMEEDDADSLWDWCVPGVRLYGHEKVFDDTMNIPDNHPIL